MRAQLRPRSSRAPAVTEFRIHFSSRLSGARWAALDEPLAPPVVQPSPHPTAEPTEPPAAADFWQTNSGQELAHDRARIESVLTRFTLGIEQLRADQAQRLDQVQRVAIELAMTMAARLLHRAVTNGEFPMEVKVRDMIDQLEGETPVSVRLNPADLELLESRLGGSPLLTGTADPRLIPDPTLARGDCQVHGKEAMLLSNVERELQEIRDELLGGLGHARS